MTKKLSMVFKTDEGKEVAIALPDPKDDLTKAQVVAVMDQIIAKEIFISTKGKLTTVVDAIIKSTDEVSLA